ncbi:MAG: 16S rRNA (cytidine(1402)-2'-O)-methyltransferase [Streptococcaceae bacterium]|jgi:16S rRNA (cytidine1402-2'-O)-methyltransferase|nr:16S rRNA (cytidine(1402)-2'-O)-methyltransferase [Streptococcaceae bacterium]
MNTQKSFDKLQPFGTLFLVPTPIGNLQDMTFRAIDTLKDVDFIASEDTRNTQKLLNHFEISKKQISFHEHNYKERIPQFLRDLKNGLSIAQVSDAGMPSISDPGHELVLAAIEENIAVVSLPGASAGVTALISSGISPQPFAFYGFLPRKKKEQIAFLDELKEQRESQIFYESPYRIKDTIETLGEVYGFERKVTIARELTKLHEEYLRGTIDEIHTYLQETTLKGEICFIVEGFSGEKTQKDESWQDLGVVEHVQLLIDNGFKSKDAIKEVSLLRGIKKQEVYRQFHIE